MEKKGLISLSLVKKKSPSIFLLSHPLGTVANILTFAQSHTFLIQSPQIQLTWCKVNWKTDVAGVTYRNLLIAFHCLTLPFIHSNPLTMEFRDVVNDGVSLHEWEESGFWSQEKHCRGGRWSGGRNHLHFSSSDPLCYKSASIAKKRMRLCVLY